MKKLITIVIAALFPGVAGCSSLSGSVGTSQTPTGYLSLKSNVGVKAVSGVGVHDNAMSITKSTRGPSGISETESHFALYSARFGRVSNQKVPELFGCEEAASPINASATLSRRPEPKKEGC
jgi:hypothetical protein